MTTPSMVFVVCERLPTSDSLTCNLNAVSAVGRCQTATFHEENKQTDLMYFLSICSIKVGPPLLLLGVLDLVLFVHWFYGVFQNTHSSKSSLV